MTLTEEQGGFDLAAARDAVKKCNINTTVWAHSCAKHLPGAIDLIELQTAEIERLREALDESEQILAHKTKTSTHWYEEGLQTRADLVQCKRVVEQQAARIKELEDALVEERVQVIAYQIPHAKENVNWAPVFKLSRQQLRAEGKIGPDAKPHCWQITEERKAALWHAINVLKENDIMEEPEEHLWDEEVTVLQAMMKEAGQE